MSRERRVGRHGVAPRPQTTTGGCSVGNSGRRTVGVRSDEPFSGPGIVILPRKNEKDLRDIPDEIRKSIKLILVDSMDQVLEAALRRKPKAISPEPPKVVKSNDQLDPEPEPHARVRRTNFPPTDQPPVVVRGN